jgi:predicted secreted hydrolase
MIKYQKISFPKDEQAHNAIIEWWYFNGHLKDKKGNSYAFMDCLFKADLKRVKISFLPRLPMKDIFFAHSLLSDIKNKKNYSNIHPLIVISEDSFKRPLLFVNYTHPTVRSYKTCAIEETSPFNYRLKTASYDLTLSSTKPPLMESGKGFITFCRRQSFYYSLTNLKVSGVIKINNKYVEVEGKGWMDHMWANESYNNDRWTWFSFQLENNIEIMCCRYQDKTNHTDLVDIIDAGGRQQTLKKLILTPSKETWQSSITKSRYPLMWEIEIPGRKIKIRAKALVKDQEMVFGTINYWEGPLEVEAVIGGKKVKGVGFAELVGYESHYTNTSLLINNFKKMIRESLSWSRTRIRKLF